VDDDDVAVVSEGGGIVHVLVCVREHHSCSCTGEQ